MEEWKPQSKNEKRKKTKENYEKTILLDLVITLNGDAMQSHLFFNRSVFSTLSSCLPLLDALWMDNFFCARSFAVYEVEAEKRAY